MKIPLRQDRFNENKATEAAAYVTEKLGGRINTMKLIKLLYLADRAALSRMGSRLTTDHHVSMKHGPVCSRIYSLISKDLLDPASDQESMPPFQRAFKLADQHHIELREGGKPQASELSKAEREILDAVIESHGHRTQWALRDLTHKFPEWRKPDGSRGSTPIAPVEILRAQGVSEGDIADFLEQEEADEALDRIFA